MLYTCPVDVDLSVWTYLTGGLAFRLALCQATSRDGLSWDLAPAISDNVKGLALRGTQGQQDEYMEGSFILKPGAIPSGTLDPVARHREQSRKTRQTRQIGQEGRRRAP